MINKEEIIRSYLKILEEKNPESTSEMTRPTFTDFQKLGISRQMIRREFGNMTEMHRFMDSEHDTGLFSGLDRVMKTSGKLKVKKGVKRYLITTAVGDCKAHVGFLNSISTWNATHADGTVIIMPCESKTNSFHTGIAVFDSEFVRRKFLILNGDMSLNETLSLLSIQVSANQIQPTTGLNRLGSKKRTHILASPKQFLEFGARTHSDQDMHAIMTTGACTVSNYKTDTFSSKRLSYIANHDHCLGGIIVEVESDRIFHFRHFQANEDGEFIDLGTKFKPDGTTEKVAANLVLGDIHAYSVDLECLMSFMQWSDDQFVAVNDIFIHDLFDGFSINHHEKNPGDKARRESVAYSSLENELIETRSILQSISSYASGKTYVVKSNHDEWLTRYFNEGRYIEDGRNHQLSLKLAQSLFEETDDLEYALTHFGELDKNIEFLSRDGKSVSISGVEMSAHGDLGQNGSTASLRQLESIYRKCVVGHAHSGAIHRGVFRVGTFTPVRMKYNRGPSTWTQTAAIVYPDGSCQLVNRVSNKWCL